MEACAISGFVRGVENKRGDVSLHTDNLYWHALVSVIVEICELKRVPPRQLHEDWGILLFASVFQTRSLRFANRFLNTNGTMFATSLYFRLITAVFAVD
jgi:hypothetical protein